MYCTLYIILNNAESTFIFFIGVVEYLSTGGVETNHKDFKELRYNESLTNFSCNGKNGTTNGRITHGFKLKSAYESGLMPYTNYTFDFKVSLEMNKHLKLHFFFSRAFYNFVMALNVNTQNGIKPSWISWQQYSYVEFHVIRILPLLYRYY